MLRRFFALASILSLVGLALGDDPVVRIEEDWELQVIEPDSDVTAPQIITAWGPGSGTGIHATFEVNHLSSVAFATGGLHLSTWNGDTHLQLVHNDNSSSMSTLNEAVRWTQSMEISNGQLVFEVFDGHSSTWNDFGNNHSLRLALDTDLTDLSSYDPVASISNSEVSYAGNRVQTLSIKRIRYIHASGAVTSENAQRYVHLAD